MDKIYSELTVEKLEEIIKSIMVDANKDRSFSSDYNYPIEFNKKFTLKDFKEVCSR